MGGGGYDPGLDELQSFCSILEGTNTLLELATEDLEATGKTLVEEEPDLREALTALVNQTDGLQKEVETASTSAAGALARLGSTAQSVLETRLPLLDAEVDGYRRHSDEAMNAREESLQPEFDALDTQGFDAFESIIDAEKEDVDRWIEQGEAALGVLSEALERAGEAHAGEVEQAATELKEGTEATQGVHDDLSGWLGAHAHHLAVELAEGLEKRAADAGQGMVDWMAERQDAMRAEADTARGLIRDVPGGVVAALEEAESKAAATVEATGPVLQQADVDFEQVLADVRSCSEPVAAVAQLRPAIETADAEVTEIRALMQVLDQP